MPCTDTAAFNNYALHQLDAAGIHGDDYLNASQYLISISPFVSQALRDSFAQLVTRDLAYFILGTDGCPILVVPPASPSYAAYQSWVASQQSSSSQSSSSAPAGSSGVITPPLTSSSAHTGEGASSSSSCPPGFVAQAPGFVSTTTIEEMVNHQLLQIPMREDLAAGACKPLPTVTTAGVWVTPEDCLQVSILTTQRTSGLILVARILDCAGLLHYMSYGLDNVPVAVRTTVTLPLTPGYLLDVAVSALGSGLPAGSVFTSVGLQHTCAPGVPPSSILGAGYVSDLYAVSWPAGTTGAPYAAPTALPGPAVPTIMQYGSALTPTDTTGVTVTLSQTVSAGSALVAFCGTQGRYVNNAVTDDQGNVWALIERNGYQDLWIAPNAKAGVTKVTSQHTGSTGISQMLHVLELARIAASSPVDVTAANSNGGPITATTASTSVADVAVAIVTGLNAVTAGVTPPAGWTKIRDTTDADSNRMVSLVNLTLSTPPAAWAFTSTMLAADTYLTLAALKVATA